MLPFSRTQTRSWTPRGNPTTISSASLVSWRTYSVYTWTRQLGTLTISSSQVGRSGGGAPLELKELCRRQGRSFYFLNGHRMLDSYDPPNKNRKLKNIALTSWDGHAYLFSSARAVCTRHLASSDTLNVPARLANDAQHEMPPITEWKPWNGTAVPGYHYTDDLSADHVQLLLSGRSPKVVLRSAVTADMVALRYVCVKGKDGVTGTCVIRRAPRRPSQH